MTRINKPEFEKAILSGEDGIHYKKWGNLISSPEWDVHMVRCALAAHEQGNFDASYLLSESMMRDPIVSSTVQIRTSLSMKCELSVESHTFDSDIQKVAASACMDLTNRLLSNGVFEQMARQKILMGFSYGQIIWDEMWEPSVEPWEANFISYRPIFYAFSYEDKRNGWIVDTTKGQIELQKEQYRWILCAPGGIDRSFLDGAVRSIAIPWLAGQYALKDWLNYSELHGSPIIKGKYPAGSLKDPAKNDFLNTVRSLGDHTITLPQNLDQNTGYDVELIGVESDATGAFKGIIDDTQNKIRSKILGSDFDQGGGGLGAGMAGIKQNMLYDLALSDAKAVLDSIYHYVLRPYCLWKFGSAEYARKVIPSIISPNDKEASAKRMASFARTVQSLLAANAPVDIRAFLMQNGIPVDEARAAQVKESDVTGHIYKHYIDSGLVEAPKKQAQAQPEVKQLDAKVELSEASGDPITRDGNKENFDEIQKLAVAAAPILFEFTKQVKARILKAYQTGGVDALNAEVKKIVAEVKTKREKKLEALASEVFDLGASEAYHELNKPSRATKGDSKNEAHRLLLLAALLIASSFRRRVEAGNEDFFETYLEDTNTGNSEIFLTTQSFGTYNKGKAEVFKKAGKNVKFTAILDDKTSKICRHTNGTVMSVDDPNLAEITPPLHGDCRSTLVPTADEPTKFDAEMFAGLYKSANSVGLDFFEEELAKYE